MRPFWPQIREDKRGRIAETKAGQAMSTATAGGTVVPAAAQSFARQFLPFTFANFLGFLAIGIPLSVLSLQVHEVLGFGPVVVGVVLGAQTVVTFLTRQYAGSFCDRRGTKPASQLGLLLAIGAAALYFLSSLPLLTPVGQLGILLLGRFLLGLAESLFITGLAAWSLPKVGQQHAGRTMAWQGIAMYGSMALGAPFGVVLYDLGGFGLVALATMLMPAAALGLVTVMQAIHVTAEGERLTFWGILRAIWLPGSAIALGASAFGVLAAFLPLRFQAEGWGNPGLVLTALGAAYILVRLFLAHLPDRLGGIVTAVPCLIIQASGLLMIWAAGSRMTAIAAGAVIGLGYSLVYPSLGVEALRRVAPQDRSLALAGILAFFDLGLGLAGPTVGLVVRGFGLGASFLTAAGAVLVALVLTLACGRTRPKALGSELHAR